MENNDDLKTTRGAIIHFFRESPSIEPGKPYTCAKIIAIVYAHRSEYEAIDKAKDIGHSVRQVLQTADGYPCPPNSPNNLINRDKNKRPYEYTFQK